MSNSSPLFQQIISSRQLRCGYITPFSGFIKGRETNKLSGFQYDLVEHIGERLDLEIVWQPECHWHTFQNILHANDCDMIPGIIPTGIRAKKVAFSSSYLQVPFGLLVGEHTSAVNIEQYNDQRFSIAVIEGELSEALAKEHFPIAHHMPVPNPATIETQLELLINGEVDAVICEQQYAFNYSEAVGSTLQLCQTPDNWPIGVFDCSFGLPQGEPELKNMLDTVLREMQLNRVFQKIAAQHSDSTGYLQLM